MEKAKLWYDQESRCFRLFVNDIELIAITELSVKQAALDMLNTDGRITLTMDVQIVNEKPIWIDSLADRVNNNYS